MKLEESMQVKNYKNLKKVYLPVIHNDEFKIWDTLRLAMFVQLYEGFRLILL